MIANRNLQVVTTLTFWKDYGNNYRPRYYFQGAATVYPSQAPDFTPGFFGGVRVAHHF